MERYIVTPQAFPLAHTRRGRSLIIEAASHADAVAIAAHHVGDLSGDIQSPSAPYRDYWSGTTHAYHVRANVAAPAGTIVGIERNNERSEP